MQLPRSSRPRRRRNWMYIFIPLTKYSLVKYIIINSFLSFFRFKMLYCNWHLAIKLWWYLFIRYFLVLTILHFLIMKIFKFTINFLTWSPQPHLAGVLRHWLEGSTPQGISSRETPTATSRDATAGTARQPWSRTAELPSKLQTSAPRSNRTDASAAIGGEGQAGWGWSARVGGKRMAGVFFRAWVPRKLDY
jgi:hypothetical protein